jgi:hypothetical protein
MASKDYLKDWLGIEISWDVASKNKKALVGWQFCRDRPGALIHRGRPPPR